MTKIYQEQNAVVLEYADEFGDKSRRVFFVPGGRGVVREDNGRQQDPCVCAGLRGTGVTVEATQDTLLSVVRREWKRAQDAERRRHTREMR